MPLTKISPNKIKTGIDEFKRIVIFLGEGNEVVKVVLWPWQFEDMIKSINNQEVRTQ